MLDWFHKTLPKNAFCDLLELISHLERKRNIYTRMLDFIFPSKK